MIVGLRNNDIHFSDKHLEYSRLPRIIKLEQIWLLLCLFSYLFRTSENMSCSKFFLTTALFCFLFYLYKLETGKQSLSVVTYKFHNVQKSELFDTVTHADTVPVVRFRHLKNIFVF